MTTDNRKYLDRLKGIGLIALAVEIIAAGAAWSTMDKEPKTSFLVAFLAANILILIFFGLSTMIIKGLDLLDRSK